MSVKIGSNILSMNAQRRLAEATDAVGSIYERLSSGMRINKASDDAAGLSIASTLNTQSRISSQSIRNINDGVSLLNIAEGALSELTNVSIRIKELAVQSANGTFSGKQRLAIQAESNALVSEFNRVISSVSFNGSTLLDGELDRLSIQLGLGQGSFADRQISVGLTDALKRNIGTGTLNAGVSFAIGADVIGVASADFNGDGKVDYAVNGSDGQLRIFTGNGDGTFATGQVLASGVRELETADINNDGIMDLITVSPGSLITFLGNGNATFSAGRTFAISGNNLNGIGDFNNDGIIDVMTQSYSGNSVSISIGNGDGTFGAGASRALGFNSPLGSIGVDLNNDGNLDLLSYGEGGVSVMFGMGNGNFGTASLISASYTDSVQAVDFDKDGNIDLVTAVGDAVRIQMGNGNGTFGAIRTIETGLGGSSARDMKVADMNGDGYEDIILTAYGTDQVRIILGNGNGTFGARTSITSVDTPIHMTISDFTGDGVNDLIIHSDTGNSTQIFTQQSTTTTTIQRFDLTTRQSALSVLGAIDETINRISRELGNIGSARSRLETASRTVKITQENINSAKSRILDADVAEEAASLIRQQILQRAAVSILGQANLQPQLAVTLIQSRS